MSTLSLTRFTGGLRWDKRHDKSLVGMKWEYIACNICLPLGHQSLDNKPVKNELDNMVGPVEEVIEGGNYIYHYLRSLFSIIL